MTLFPKFPNSQELDGMLTAWERLLDSLASDGGHIVLWVTGCGAGMFMMWAGFDIVGDHLLTASTAGLGIALKTSMSNAARRQEMGAATLETKEVITKKEGQ